MLKAIGEISKVADFTTPCVNITNSAFSQLSWGKNRIDIEIRKITGNGTKLRTCKILRIIRNTLSMWQMTLRLSEFNFKCTLEANLRRNK